MLKVYVDLLSQPSRAVMLFVKQNKIPHEMKIVDLFRGEHRTPDYIKNVHPFGKVPAIDDDGFKLMESIAILRYLSRKYNVKDHWYPQDLKKQARVDEFLEWHHIGARAPLAMYFRTYKLIPLLTGKPAPQDKLDSWKTKMEVTLEEMEKVWLERSPYLGGNEMSIADLIGLCEIDQTRMTDYDVEQGRPKIAAWLKKVRSELQPDYEEVTKIMNKMIGSKL